jgi:hypothetical protein
MSAFETAAPQAGRWVRRGPNVIVLDDPWSDSPRKAVSAQELEAWTHESGRDEVMWVQSSLNRVMGSGLTVDGVVGPMTRAAIMAFQRAEGLAVDGIVGPITRAALQRKAGGGSPTPAPSAPAAGVGTFDGVACASWLIPYLTWARAHGWQGRLNSGWRSPEHSERICFDMCGSPTCPGRCAGRSSKHSASVKPNGAIDVSDETRFGQLMAQCPFSPRIFNDLPNDRIHFSATGH